MSILDDVLRVNAEFVRTYDSRRATAPVNRRLAIVACMDYRIPLGEAFGLNPGDAYIIRNAGGVVTGVAIGESLGTARTVSQDCTRQARRVKRRSVATRAPLCDDLCYNGSKRHS